MSVCLSTASSPMIAVGKCTANGTTTMAMGWGRGSVRHPLSSSPHRITPTAYDTPSTRGVVYPKSGGTRGGSLFITTAHAATRRSPAAAPVCPAPAAPDTGTDPAKRTWALHHPMASGLGVALRSRVADALGLLWANRTRHDDFDTAPLPMAHAPSSANIQPRIPRLQ
jgi:hypothetical protein